MCLGNKDPSCYISGFWFCMHLFCIFPVSDVNQDPASAVDTWYNENAYYTYKFNNCTEGKECGEYKQVWRYILCRLLTSFPPLSPE